MDDDEKINDMTWFAVYTSPAHGTKPKKNRKRILLGADAKLDESKSFGETTFVRENVIPSIQVK